MAPLCICFTTFHYSTLLFSYLSLTSLQFTHIFNLFSFHSHYIISSYYNLISSHLIIFSSYYIFIWFLFQSHSHLLIAFSFILIRCERTLSFFEANWGCCITAQGHSLLFRKSEHPLSFQTGSSRRSVVRYRWCGTNRGECFTIPLKSYKQFIALHYCILFSISPPHWVVFQFCHH